MIVAASTHSAMTVTVDSTPEERAQKMLDSMTLEDKLRMMRGSRGDYVGNIEGNTRLGIPSLNMQDGPQGFRITKKTGDPGAKSRMVTPLHPTS